MIYLIVFPISFVTKIIFTFQLRFIYQTGDRNALKKLKQKTT